MSGQCSVEPNWWKGRRRYEAHWERIFWPPCGAGSLSRQEWVLGAPEGSGPRLVVAASEPRARSVTRALGCEDAQVLAWWQDGMGDRVFALGEGAGASIVDRVYIVDGPPHRWALEALCARLSAGAVVHWDPRALDPQPVLKRWERLVRDAESLRALWRARREGRSPLVPGRRVLRDLGLSAGERPDRRRELQESLYWRTGWYERRIAEADWHRGGPWAWREEERQRGLAE